MYGAPSAASDAASVSEAAASPATAAAGNTAAGPSGSGASSDVARAALARNPAAHAISCPPAAVKPCSRISSDGNLAVSGAKGAAAGGGATPPLGGAQQQVGGAAEPAAQQRAVKGAIPPGHRRMPGRPLPHLSVKQPSASAAKSSGAAGRRAAPHPEGAAASDGDDDGGDGSSSSNPSTPTTPTGHHSDSATGAGPPSLPQGSAAAAAADADRAATGAAAGPAGRRQPIGSLSSRALSRGSRGPVPGGTVSLERTLLGVISCLVSELRSGKLAHLAAGLSNVDPLSAVLVWHHQRATRRARSSISDCPKPRPLIITYLRPPPRGDLTLTIGASTALTAQARKADAEYLGPDLPPFDVPPLAPALRALRHAGGVYGSLARAFTHAEANFGDLVKARS